MRRRLIRTIVPASAVALGLAAVVFGAAPATADSVSPATCLSGCTAVFDTVGTTTFTVPPAAVDVTATVVGAAGAAAPVAITLDPTAVGGPGGDATVDLGTNYSGASLDVSVGGTGGGSSIASGGSLLAVAGGGGGGGYAGLLNLPGQIFATYPGGVGGSPAAPGVAAGTSGSAFGTLAANGGGGTSAGGVGGSGDAAGTSGVAPDDTQVVAGGLGGTLVINSTTHTGGAGGSGYSGGGGGAIARNVPNGDDSVDVVAPGGGGSGFLAAGLTATTGPANAGGASVTFTWSFAPTASTTTTTAHPGDAITVSVAGLPSNVPFTVTFDGATVATGTSDPSGAATVTFTVAADQELGSFPVQIVVGGAVAASTTDVAVVAAPVTTPTTTPTTSASTGTLAATGSTLPVWLIAISALAIAAGAGMLVLRRRMAKH